MNIAKLLCTVAAGTKLYSTIFGYVTFKEVTYTGFIIVICKDGNKVSFLSNGAYTANGEICLFPSKENRDWNTFSTKLHEFKPFDKVLVRNKDSEIWKADLFSHYVPIPTAPYACVTDCYRYCIPYVGNDYLVGTSNNPYIVRMKS